MSFLTTTCVRQLPDGLDVPVEGPEKKAMPTVWSRRERANAMDVSLQQGRGGGTVLQV